MLAASTVSTHSPSATIIRDRLSKAPPIPAALLETALAQVPVAGDRPWLRTIYDGMKGSELKYESPRGLQNLWFSGHQVDGVVLHVFNGVTALSFVTISGTPVGVHRDPLAALLKQELEVRFRAPYAVDTVDGLAVVEKAMFEKLQEAHWGKPLSFRGWLRDGDQLKYRDEHSRNNDWTTIDAYPFAASYHRADQPDASVGYRFVIGDTIQSAVPAATAHSRYLEIQGYDARISAVATTLFNAIVDYAEKQPWARYFNLADFGTSELRRHGFSSVHTDRPLGIDVFKR